MNQANNISYKDTAARVFIKEGIYYRYIFNEYKLQYDTLMQSGLYNALITKNYIIAHSEINYSGEDNNVYKLILPEQIHFQSYPYCWSYTQWRKAIITYLEINKIALEFGMILKDATPFNFYFKEGKALLLDTSSFIFFKENESWTAYNQFCTEFFSPLALMFYNGQIWSSMLKANIKGLPLHFVSKQLPVKSWFNLSCFLHIHMHAKYASINTGTKIVNSRKSIIQKGFSKVKLVSLIDMLLTTVKNWEKAYDNNKYWEKYYENNIESELYLSQKEKIVKNWLVQIKPKTVIDLGANTGKFSFLAAEIAEQVVAMDSDYNCVDAIQNTINNGPLKNIQVLQMNLAQTSPNLGILEKEYSSIFERVRKIRSTPILVFSLAIIHHLYITDYLSFEQIAELLANFNGKYLIVEFIPIQDSKVQLLINNKKRDFSEYTLENFTNAFLKYFKIIQTNTLLDSKRELFLLEINNIII